MKDGIYGEQVTGYTKINTSNINCFFNLIRHYDSGINQVKSM